MKITILDIHGNYTDKIIKINEDKFLKKSYHYSLYLEIKRYLHSQRQGTHKSKERGEVTGSNRKIHRQKGTGSSRKGTIKNPIFRGGGRVFGPKPRNYSIKLNKKIKNKVKRFILEYKIMKNRIKIIENIALDNPKTKFFSKLLLSLKLNNIKSMMIIDKFNRNLYLSSRNIKKFKLIQLNELDSFSLLHFSYIIVCENSIKHILNFLSI
ncbi:50S ribosomal protein L4 [Blattabacterium cuenoti]|uniref:50S ribosomal protein L4 n=1 Tax=Blattabacterium cuenoti TaxID=1653831 RepID=UPI00163C294A|nr:50S ribosomal protein L4 [Blattabacterium cuenoti]